MSTLLETPRGGNTVVPLESRRSKRHDPRRQAETLTRSLTELRRQGACYEIQNSIPDIIAIAHLTKKAGDPVLAARLYTDLARTFHIYGQLDEADHLLQTAVKTGDFIGDVMNDITRLRALIALDREDTDKAREIIGLADRPVLIKSATVVRELVEGHGWMTRRDDSEAGERVMDKSGTASPATMLIEAEIMMLAEDHRGAHQMLIQVGRKLFNSAVPERKLDDMAMLALLLTLSHERPDSGALDILHDLTEDWRAKGAGAPVISKMRAAAGDEDESLLRAINQFEGDRFRVLGANARAPLAAPAPKPSAILAPAIRTEPPAAAAEGHLLEISDSDPLAISPAPSTMREESDEDETPLDFGSFTNDDIENLFDSIKENQTPKLTLLPQTGDRAEGAETLQAGEPGYRWQIGPGTTDLPSMIKVIENSLGTGCMHVTLGSMWAKVYFQTGRVAYAEHHAEPETPYEAFKRLCQWSETTDHLLQVEFKPTEAVEAPLTLLNSYHSNTQLILIAITDEKDTEQEGTEAAPAAATPPPPQPPQNAPDSSFADLAVPEEVTDARDRQPAQLTETVQEAATITESKGPPTSANTVNTANGLPDKVINALDAMLEARSMQELVTVISDHVEGMGAKGTRTRVLIGDKPTTLASSSRRETDGSKGSPRTTLVESPPLGPTNLRVTIEAVEPPPGEFLRSLSVLARAARASAEMLPAKPKSNIPTEPSEEDFAAGLVWKSSAMFDVVSTIMQIAPMDGMTLPIANVLITGETGTGKDKIARYIHDRSGRSEMPFKTVNCAAIPKDLFESEIFGHRKGSFTGAIEDKPGLIEIADGGTIFFTEFAEVPRDVQAKLLTVLDTDGQYTRIGESHNIRKANVRFIFATNRNVHDPEVMRTDIFHRCPGKIHLKPLRERRDDIPVLAHFFADKFNLKLTDAGAGYLQDLDWPGNIRELQNTLQMATTTAAKDRPVTSEQLRAACLKANPPSDQIVAPVNEIIPKLIKGQSLKQIIEDFEAHVFRTAYERYEGKLPRIVTVSGMSKNTVRAKLITHGISESRNQDYREDDRRPTSSDSTHEAPGASRDEATDEPGIE